MMYSYASPFVGLFLILTYAAFWVGVGALIVWVSKQPLKERNLLLAGLVLVAASVFLVTIVGVASHPALRGMMGGYDGPVRGGWMMGNWMTR